MIPNKIIESPIIAEARGNPSPSAKADPPNGPTKAPIAKKLLNRAALMSAVASSPY